MGLAPLNQNFQDWLTQQWVILTGQKVVPNKDQWLIGPFGKTKGIGQKFIHQLAFQENLELDTIQQDKGIIQSIYQLNLSPTDHKNLSREVSDFYENTSNYSFDLSVKWNPFFKVFGILLRLLFSRRIQQLDLPLGNKKKPEALTSEIIHLVDKKTKAVCRTIWLRSFKKSGNVVYSGVYETCINPKGVTCIKAIFPLPNGNASVVLSPSVGKSGELILQSSGSQFGDCGFYFLLEDIKGNRWAKYIKSFKDELIIRSRDGKISAEQTLRLWNLKVLVFNYQIKKHSLSK
jgi:hypothetical protein